MHTQAKHFRTNCNTINHFHPAGNSEFYSKDNNNDVKIYCGKYFYITCKLYISYLMQHFSFIDFCFLGPLLICCTFAQNGLQSTSTSSFNLRFSGIKINTIFGYEMFGFCSLLIFEKQKFKHRMVFKIIRLNMVNVLFTQNVKKG